MFKNNQRWVVRDESIVIAYQMAESGGQVAPAPQPTWN